MPRVTVIIPSYNHAAYLAACLESIQAQTFEDWEALVIDDGSRDGSVGIAESLAAKDTRISVYRNAENRGTYGTQQRGVEMAHGELVAIMNSDDGWGPTKLERQIQLLDAHPESRACFTRGWMMDESGVADTGTDVHTDWPTEPVQETLPNLLESNRILASGVMFRRSGLQFDESCRYSGDWVAMIGAARMAPLLCVPDRLTHWRQHATNTYTASPGQMREEIRVREAIRAADRYWLGGRWEVGTVRNRLAENARHLGALYAFFGEIGRARRCAWDAVRLSQGGPAAVRRLAATLMPASRVRRRLWPQSEGAIPTLGTPSPMRLID